MVTAKTPAHASPGRSGGSDSNRRSMPMANPIPGAGGPPSPEPHEAIRTYPRLLAQHREAAPSAEDGATGLAADAVEVELPPGNLQGVEQVREEVEDLGVEGGVLHPGGLSPDLMELPKPARLGALVAEHRTDGIDLTEAPLGEGAVAEAGPA